ncbi:MAG: OPT/YSL family transporter [Nitrososphaerota archaeon]
MSTELEKTSPVELLEYGISWRVILAILTAAVLFIPVSLYLNLISGALSPAIAVTIIAILFAELTRFFGAPLRKQELFVIYSSVAVMSSTLPPYYWLVYRTFYVTTPITQYFLIDGTPINQLVPTWLAPPAFSPVYQLRTLLHPDWTYALIVTGLSFALLAMAEIGLAIMFTYIFVKEEKLNYPLAHVEASLISVLIEREEQHMSIYILGIVTGVVYAFMTYAGFLLGVPLLPIPWFDFVWITEKYIPGALVGVATDPFTLGLGMVLPVKVAVSTLIGSIAIWTIANTIFTSSPNFFPLWFSEYYKGMTIGSIYQRSFQRIWISPQFGFIIGIAVALILAFRKTILRSFRLFASAIVRPRETELPLRFALTLFLVASIGSVILFLILVPGFPAWIALVTSLVLSFFIAMVAARSLGEVGYFPAIPWPWQVIVYFTPYNGYAGWVYSPYINLGYTGYLSQLGKVSYLTSTRPTHYFIGVAGAFALIGIIGLISMDFFWRLSPIPSNVYPITMIYWPIYATNDSLFATRQIAVIPEHIGIGALSTLGIVSLEVLFRRIGLAFPTFPIVLGFFILPPYAITILIGSLLANIIISKTFGKERWEAIKNFFIAGFFSGLGITVGVGISFTLLSKASWIWPW